MGLSEELLQICPVPLIEPSRSINGRVTAISISDHLCDRNAFLTGYPHFFENTGRSICVSTDHDENKIGTPNRSTCLFFPRLHRSCLFERRVNDLKRRVRILPLADDEILQDLVVVEVEADEYPLLDRKSVV